MLVAAFLESSHTESIRPLGATPIVPNQCHLFGCTGSSLIRCGALNVAPPSVLRENITSVPLPPKGLTLATMQMLLLGAPPERSTARKIWPASPPGFTVPPKTRLPPRFTVVIWSNVGVTAGFCALLDRMHKKLLPE